MATYRYEHGFNHEDSRMSYPLSIRRATKNVNYVRTVDGEIFLDTNLYNDKDLPCYKVVTLVNGEKRNVNMNNGIAYRI